MKSAGHPAARRYARAALEVALDQKLDAAALRAELEAWARLVQEHADAREALTSPAVGPEARQRATRALADRVKATPLARRLLEMLAANGRMAILPAVARAFAEQWNTHQGVTPAEVITAAPLDGGLREALVRALSARTGGEVELTATVEPQLLGGVVVKMAGRTYDGSVRARLGALRARLSGTAG